MKSMFRTRIPAGFSCIINTGMYDKKIHRSEDALTDRLWQEIGDAADYGTPDSGDIGDLRQRIRQAERRRSRTAGILSAAGAAAVLFLILWLPMKSGFSPKDNDSPLAQLKSMGVAVSDKQVSLKMDNDISLSLADSALFTSGTDRQTSIVSSPGIEVEVGNERMLRLEVPSGKQFRLTLSDGTEVWLNSDSVLEYPASFDGCSHRDVYLTGEAYFEVARDEDCPFIVNLDNDEKIEVLGTSFNVNSYPDNDCNVTTLVSGKIAYRHDSSDKEVILLPDQQICVDRAEGSAEIREVDAGTTVDWKGNYLTFENESLPVLARRLSRMYGIEIIVGEHLAGHTFTGRISYDKGVDFITKRIEETSGIRCSVSDGKIILD